MKRFYFAILNILPKQQKNKFIGLFLISFLASILETATISSIFPFMSLVTSPDKIHTEKYYSVLYTGLGFSSSANFIIAAGLIIVILFVIKTCFNTFAIYFSNKVGHDTTYELQISSIKNLLERKYIYSLRDNKSALPELLSNTNHIAVAISHLATIVTELLVVTIMYVILVVFNWKIMLCITLFLTVNILFVQKFLHPLSAKLAKISWYNHSMANRFVTSLSNNYKIAKLSKEKQIYINEYNKFVEIQHHSECRRMTLERQPKNILELSGFLIMIGLIIYQEFAHGIGATSMLIPIISLLMITFYRMLPSVTRIIEAKNTITYVMPLIERLELELTKKTEVEPCDNKISFNERFILQNIQFSYVNQHKPILKDMSLTINKGEHVAFIGKSGSGKSTLIDIMIGLYDSEDSMYHLSGDILIDGKKLRNEDLASWRNNIGYIPQEIYLFDGTVAENIVMYGDFDEQRVINALEKASIWHFLKEKDGINTQVGDGGVMLSGGQKQRIGIARALYRDPEIIVMDEATSALDDQTEQQIIEELNNSARDKTIIMIAHRISSLKYCDKIYKLNHGKIESVFNSHNEII